MAKTAKHTLSSLEELVRGLSPEVKVKTRGKDCTVFNVLRPSGFEFFVLLKEEGGEFDLTYWCAGSSDYTPTPEDTAEATAFCDDIMKALKEQCV